MNNVILPENISVGFFDAKNKYVNIDITKRRAVKIFEIELPIESGGISYIDDDKAPIEPTTLICAKPGQMRRTRLPFRCRYIHVMVTHGAIYDILISAPNYIKIGDYSEYKKIFSDMYEYYNRAESKAIIMLSSLFLRLVYLIHKDSHNMPEVNGLSLGCNSLIQNAISYMKENIEKPLTLSEIAAYVSLSPVYFHNCFKAAIGKTPHDFLTEQRIKRATILLISKDWNLAEIAYACGFSSQSYFNYVFKREMGLTPREYVKVSFEKYEKTITDK